MTGDRHFILIYPSHYIPELFYGMLSITPGYCVLTSSEEYHILVARGSDGGGGVHTELIRGSHPLSGKSRGDFKV